MKPQISAQLGQSINLTPQLLQSIRLLQLNAPQLELEIRAALDRNPLLELDEHDEAGETEIAADEDFPGPDSDVAAFDEFIEPAFAATPSRAAGDGLEDSTARLRASESSDPRLRLLQGLGTAWTDADLGIAVWWLDHVDDRGYLEGSADVLVLEGAMALGVPAADLRRVRAALLLGEFPGMTAESLQECLVAQLSVLPAAPARDLGVQILSQHADLLAQGLIADLSTACSATDQEVAAALDLLRTLQTNPVQEAPVAESDYIVPDVVAWKAAGQWHVSLNNSTIPQVRISAFAEQALAQASDAGDLRSMLEDARWLVRGLAMRNDTLLRTVQVLVRRQQSFLDGGEEMLVPLTLSDVAAEIEMHESTVSRITAGKYIQTPRGMIELKQLFASRLDGADVSGTAVRAMVKRMIDSEPANAPLADSTIASMLAGKGIRLARRTVAKYRDQLAIAPARSRGRSDMTGTY